MDSFTVKFCNLFDDCFTSDRGTGILRQWSFGALSPKTMYACDVSCKKSVSLGTRDAKIKFDLMMDIAIET